MEVGEFIDEGLGHSSHLVCLDGTALVIDPHRSAGATIEQRAPELETAIAWTAGTHSRAGGIDAWAASTGRDLKAES